VVAAGAVVAAARVVAAVAADTEGMGEYRRC
jgi:hypothetical protein